MNRTKNSLIDERKQDSFKSIFDRGEIRVESSPFLEISQEIEELDEQTFGKLKHLAVAVRKNCGDTRAYSNLKKKTVVIRVGTSYEQVRVLNSDDLDNAALDSKFSKWLKGEANFPFPKDVALKCLFCFAQQGDENRMLFEHEYYHQLLSKLDSAAVTVGKLATESTGIYQCFRPSVIYPGKFVFGMLGVASINDVCYLADGCRRDEIVVKTVELHRFFKRGDGDSKKADILAGPDVEEIFSGYMVKKSRQVLMHSFEMITKSFQYTVVSNFILGGSGGEGDRTNFMPGRGYAKMQMMSGISVGLIGQSGFFSVPTVFIRHSDIQECKGDVDILCALKNCDFYKSIGIMDLVDLPDFVRVQFSEIEKKVFLGSHSYK